MKIMAIKDRATDAYHVPFFTKTVNEAIRMIKNELARPESQLAAHPSDYDLYELGAFDENNGLVHSDGPHLRARAQDLVNTA